MSYVLDPERTEVIVETVASGMLARLAHDLRLDARGASGAAASEREVHARFPVAGLAVRESRRHGSEGYGRPDAADAATIERKIRDEVFAPGDEVVIEAALEGERATLTLTTARGRQRLVTPVRVQRDDDFVTVRGEVTLSLAALGGREPKVPLGAVRLADAIRVRFSVVWKRASDAHA